MIKSQWIIFATILQGFCRESFVMAMKKTGKKSTTMFHEEKNFENYIEKNNPYLYNTCRTKNIHETCILSNLP